jgi:mRNA interferase YafQ
MRYLVQRSKRFKKQYKKLRRSGNERVIKELQKVIELLVAGETLPSSLRNHELSGALHGLYECHVLPDWLLVYTIDHEQLLLELFSTGTHSELFG